MIHVPTFLEEERDILCSSAAYHLLLLPSSSSSSSAIVSGSSSLVTSRSFSRDSTAFLKVFSGAPNEILLVLDGNTGLNMLPQAREFNEVVGIMGLILTKLDGSARGGCVVSVVEELVIPVKFIGVGEAVEDLQPFDAEAFVNAIFS